MNQDILRKYKKIQDLFYRSNFKDRGFICKNCGKKFRTFHGNHFKACGMSKDEYINKYGYPNKYYEKDAILKEVTNKIEDLYIVNRSKWIILNGKTRVYTTYETHKIREENQNRSQEEKKIEKLTTSQIKAHLEGRNTLGVFPKWSTSKFMVFDIDSYSGLQHAEEVAKDIKGFLTNFFPKNQIHVNHSGNKGHHITLYFNTFIEIKVLSRLFNIVLNGIQIEKYRDVRVEMRPTVKGPEGCGIKLPLGVNFINRDDYNNYAFFVDDNFKKVEFEVEYVLSIEKSSSDIVWGIIDLYKGTYIKDYGENFIYSDTSKEDKIEVIFQNKNNNITDKGTHSKIQWIIENGLEEQGTRHYWSFLIALYYKQIGINENEACNLLMEWSKKQIDSGRSKSSLIEVTKDIKYIIYKGVYDTEKNYNLPNSDACSKDVFLNSEDLNKFMLINNYGKSQGSMMLNHQKIFFALLVHGKINHNFNGEFYMTYNQILSISHLVSRDVVNKCITELELLGFIEIVSRNSEYDRITGKKKPNVFKMVFNDNIDNEINISTEELKDKECFYRVICRYYGMENLDKVFKRSMKYKVLKMNLDCCSKLCFI